MLLQSFKMAWNSIVSNKLRSFLTMLGIIIGVMALVVLVSLVSGTTNSVQNTISSISTDLITVTVNDDEGHPLKLSGLDEFASDETVGNIAPIAQASLTAKSGSSSESATVYGTTASYADICGLSITQGRFIYSLDNDMHSNVAVISHDIATEILGTPNAVGSEIRLNGSSFTVIGVLEDDDSSSDSVYTAYIPYNSLVRQSSSVDTDITSFVVSAAQGADIAKTQADIEQRLFAWFGNEDDYSIINQSEIAEAMESVTNVLALLLGGIAAISLLVGGIGIMNIMLVSVTERTREIGIRKAIGATRSVIMLQFLIESLVVTLIGCAIGIAGSWLALQAASVFAAGADYNLSFSMSGDVVCVAVAFSLVIGVVFGLYPANKAARKNPIEALRYAG